jgi:nitrite reductase (NADH) large subunit
MPTNSPLPRSEGEATVMAEKLVIIGNGMAPGRMLEHLLEKAPGRYSITIFNAEPRVNYDRIMLSPVLSGEKDFEEIIIHGDGWYIKNGITLYKGHKIVALDRTAKTVTSDHGVVEPYDRLVIATGSVPFIIPVPGNDLPGVLTGQRLWSSAAACSGWRRPPVSASAAWTSPCST